MEIPNSLCWNITSRCNDKCQFCYCDRESKDLSFEDRIKVINRIVESGIKKMTFAGGEPLLVPEIKELILYAKSKSMIVSLTTNAILMNKEMQEFCFKNLDWLTFSLDGANKTIQSLMTRNENHIERITEILKDASRDKKRKCKIKINTVVSQLNYLYIKDIAKLILDNNVERWKLLQFVPLRGIAKINEQKFLISDILFHEVEKDIKNYIKDKNILLSVSDRMDIENAYFVIFPNGDVKISSGLEDKTLGNALNNSLEAIWEKGGYNKEKHLKRTDFINM